MNYSVAAAALAERSLALEEAAGHYRRAIDMAEMVPSGSPAAPHADDPARRVAERCR